MDFELQQLVINGIGGFLAGPMLSGLLGGDRTSLNGRLFLGVIGGVGSGLVSSNIGIGEDYILSLIQGDLGILLQEIAEGAVGGGALATLAGWVMKKN